MGASALDNQRRAQEQDCPDERQPVAQNREGRRRSGGWNLAVETPLFAHPQMLPDDTACVDDAADPGGGGAQDRKPLFDRAHPCLREMLWRAGRAEPAIDRWIDDVVGPVGPIDHLPGKDDLVADLHARTAMPSQVYRLRPGSGPEIDLPRFKPSEHSSFSQIQCNESSSAFRSNCA